MVIVQAETSIKAPVVPEATVVLVVEAIVTAAVVRRKAESS